MNYWYNNFASTVFSGRISTMCAELNCVDEVYNNALYYEQNRAKLLSLLTLVDVLPFDGAAAAQYGIIYADLTQKRVQIGMMDALIAAHAMSCDLIIATNNTREFERVNGLIIEDWTLI